MSIVFVVLILFAPLVKQTPALEAPGMFAMLVTNLLFASPLIWILYTTDYTVTHKEIIARCGPFKWKVPRDQIHSITPSRSPLSSPALSMDRLLIRYGNNKKILVSPQNKEAFLRALGFTQEA